MTTDFARHTLRVFANGEEVPGVIVYGLRNHEGASHPNLPVDLWPDQGSPSLFVLQGHAWEVLVWEIPIVKWPARTELDDALNATLEILVKSGCRVAWVGAEGLPFSDPPRLFDPAWMSGGVLAWMTDDGVRGCGLDPDAPVSPVDDDVMKTLRAYASGLADVP